jgi:hypothetical protein
MAEKTAINPCKMHILNTVASLSTFNGVSITFNRVKRFHMDIKVIRSYVSIHT